MAEDFDPSEHYSGHWPPTDLPKVPPTPSGEYYKYAAEYFEDQGNVDMVDAFMDQYGTFTEKPVGQTFGSAESDDFDASYVDIPSDIRPSAPKALWNAVYASLAPVPGKPNLLHVTCDELNDGAVQVDKQTKQEVGQGKRPPMCHVIAFNHIRWAAHWIYQNKSHAWVKGTYKGPDPTGYPSSTWKDLVWHITNLQPGHTSCNLKTAQSAKGIPSSSKQKAAITYVASRLKTLEPSWF